MNNNPTTAPVATTAAEALLPCPCGRQPRCFKDNFGDGWTYYCLHGADEEKTPGEELWNARVRNAQQPQPVTLQSDEGCAAADLKNRLDGPADL